MKMRLCAILLLSILGSWAGLSAQAGGNPFDLSPRLTEQQAAPRSTSVSVVDNSNPFDIGSGVAASTPAPAVDSALATEAANPFEVAVDAVEKQIVPPAASTPEEAVEPLADTAYQGVLLGIVTLLLGTGTLLFIFFRTLLTKTYTALFNDNLLYQMYRERKSGSVGQFVLSYLLFFLSAALFLSLSAVHFGQLVDMPLGERFMLMLGIVGGAYLLKHSVLAVIGYVFPVDKEVSMYSFTIMIFAIAMGILLMFSSALLAYAQESWRIWIIYGTGASLLLLLALRSLRGLFIGNRFIFNYKFHFLSYLCAVELGPTLCLIKLFIPS